MKEEKGGREEVLGLQKVKRGDREDARRGKREAGEKKKGG